MILALLMPACGSPAVVQALPPTASDIRINRNEPPGCNLEGDASLVVSARFPDAEACRTFVDTYAPREQLQPRSVGEWAKSDTGRMEVTLTCADHTMKYSAVLY